VGLIVEPWSVLEEDSGSFLHLEIKLSGMSILGEVSCPMMVSNWVHNMVGIYVRVSRSGGFCHHNWGLLGILASEVIHPYLYI